MRIVGALCWFHEPPEFLARLVTSLEGIVDELVCLDGPWEHFAHSALASPADQQEALRDAAAAIDLPVRMLGGDRLWPSQVEKRSTLYSLVADLGDWMFVVDGDEEIVHHDPALRELLAETALDVGGVHITRVSPGRRGLERTARRLFRTAHGLSVIETHNGIVTDDGRWLAGPRRITKQPSLDATGHLRILHRQMSRGDLRNQWSQSYYRIRARERIEVH